MDNIYTHLRGLTSSLCEEMGDEPVFGTEEQIDLAYATIDHALTYVDAAMRFIREKKGFPQGGGSLWVQ